MGKVDGKPIDALAKVLSPTAKRDPREEKDKKIRAEANGREMRTRPFLDLPLSISR